MKAFFAKLLKPFNKLFNKEAKAIYYANLARAITEVNALELGKKFDISDESGNVLNFILLYKSKASIAIQIDIMETGHKTVPYLWLKINSADLTIQAIARDKEAFLALFGIK